MIPVKQTNGLRSKPKARDIGIVRAHTDLPKNPSEGLALTYMLYSS